MKQNRVIAVGAVGLALILGAIFYFTRPSAFSAACAERLENQKYKKNVEIRLCNILERRFFTGRQPIQEISPQTVQAPSLPIDGRVKFVVFHDPAYLSSYAYCYFAFRGWFNPKEMSPKQIALAASGFAILKSELAGYPEWLNSEKGKECVQLLHGSIHLGVTDLEKEMGDKVSIIAFNPVGAIRSDNGLDAVLKEALLTINHERIHAIHVTCPDVDMAASKHWDSLAAADREKLKQGHLNYDWNNRVVAVREAFAYLLEDNPTKVLEYAGHCPMQ